MLACKGSPANMTEKVTVCLRNVSFADTKDKIVLVRESYQS